MPLGVLNNFVIGTCASITRTATLELKTLSKWLNLGRFELSWLHPPAKVAPSQILKWSSLQFVELDAQIDSYKLVIMQA